MLYGFDGYEVDVSARELRSDGERVHLEPQVFDVLAHLVANGDRLVSREELLDEVWGDQFVSLSALTSRIKAARQALGDDGRTQRYIRNERGRGYRFVGRAVVVDSAGSNTVQLCAPGSPTTLPVVDGPLFGRDGSLDDVLGLVDAGNLVTLVGPGGIGKTRLSLEVGRRWCEERDGAAPFVRLDATADPDGVAATLATSLGVDTDRGEDVVRSCAEWLAAGENLLLLDNCEHVLSAVNAIVEELCSVAPDLPILATSREPLHLGVEHVYRLDALAVPAPGSDGAVHLADDLGPCVELFVARARRADSGFRLTEDNVGAVAALCKGFDGLPLAIELVAGRLGSLGLSDLVSGLGQRLDVGDGRSRKAQDRHRDLRSAIEWSYRLLPEDAQRLMAFMSCFPAGCSLEGVRGLTRRAGLDGSPDLLLAHLVDASMVYRSESPSGVRYRMLETLRDYGLGELASAGLDDQARDALVAYALGISQRERAYWDPAASQAGRSNRRLRDEIPNLRAARGVMLARGDIEAAVQLSSGLVAFTEEVCLAELWAWQEDLVDRTADLDGTGRTHALMLAASAARNRGRLDEARRLADEVLARDPDAWARGRALHPAAMSFLFGGDPGRAAEIWLECESAIGVRRGKIFAAMCMAYQGDIDRARNLLDECRDDVTEGNVPIDVVCNFYMVAGEVERIAGSGAARLMLERAVAIGRDADLGYSLGVAQVSLVSVLAAEGEHTMAAEGYVELIERFLRASTWPQVWTTLRNAAALLVGFDDETCLLIWAAAHLDSGAPVLDDGAREAEAALRAGAVERCGMGTAERIEQEARFLPRADVAERAGASLMSFVASP